MISALSENAPILRSTEIIFLLAKMDFWRILSLVVLGGELAVPFTRNPLMRG